MTSPSLPFVSVIVPVFNDAEHLRYCLKALEHQTYPASYEVIVVDNGSDPEQGIADVVAEFNQARVITERQPGSYAARNRGIAAAKGTVLAFTDADCIPAPDWVESGVQALLHAADCGFVAGKVEVFFRDPEHPTAVELYESLWYPLPQQEFVEKHHFGATANVITFASVIQQVGGFDSSLKSNGDREWGQRIYAAGYRPIFAEQVCVKHPARYSLEQLHRRARRIIGGRYDFQQKKSASFWQRNSLYGFTLLQYLIAPVIMLGFNLFLDRRLKTLEQRLQVSGVMFFVCFVYVTELIRLKFGADSYRG